MPSSSYATVGRESAIINNKNLVQGFVISARQHEQRPALLVDGKQVTYAALATLAGRIAATIQAHGSTVTRLGALYAYRSLSAYAAVLGILLSGRGYVPLNPRFPAARTNNMLGQSGTEVVVVGPECVAKLDELLPQAARPLLLILPEVADVSDLAARYPNHRFIAAEALAAAPIELSVPQDVDPAAPAYLLFTSGSTGDPKGVPVSHGNARAYIEFVCERYGVRCEDRVSQSFDLTFDLSVHDMFMTWERGACLCVVPEAMISAPAKFIRDQALTLWFSVPSVVAFLSRLRLLRPGLFPSLRWSLFCGEALPAKSAADWQLAANNSVIENLYGPTEATIAFTTYRWDNAIAPTRCRNGVTPIGWAFPGQRTCVVDEHFALMPSGEPGELLLSGSQVTAGYWNNPDKTRERYVQLNGRRWYRTGDRVLAEEDGCLIYLGRFDDQVKVRGYRVELQEIDAVLRQASSADQVVSVPWPVQDGSAEGVVAFVCGAPSDETVIIEHCRKFLPEHMVPRNVYFVDEMPTNANGKVDRRKLAARLDETKT